MKNKDNKKEKDEWLEFVDHISQLDFKVYLGHAKHFHGSLYGLVMIYSLESKVQTHKINQMEFGVRDTLETLTPNMMDIV